MKRGGKEEWHELWENKKFMNGVYDFDMIYAA